MDDRPAEACDSHSHLCYLWDLSSFPRVALGFGTL